MAEQTETQSCRAQLEFLSQKSIAEQRWSQESKGDFFNGYVQRGKDSSPQAIQHPVAFLLPKQEVSLVYHWGRYTDFPSAYAGENTSIISSTSSLPARGAVFWRAA